MYKSIMYKNLKNITCRTQIVNKRKVNNYKRHIKENKNMNKFTKKIFSSCNETKSYDFITYGFKIVQNASSNKLSLKDIMKSALLGSILMVISFIISIAIFQNMQSFIAKGMVCFLVALAISIGCFFIALKRSNINILISNIYCISQGVLLGITYCFVKNIAHIGAELIFLITLSTMISVISLYRLILKYKNIISIFFRILISSVLFSYIVNFILFLMDIQIKWFHNCDPIVLFISFIIVVLAFVSLKNAISILDKKSFRGVPKYMKGYCAFAIILSLFWMIGDSIILFKNEILKL